MKKAEDIKDWKGIERLQGVVDYYIHNFKIGKIAKVCANSKDEALEKVGWPADACYIKAVGLD